MTATIDRQHKTFMSDEELAVQIIAWRKYQSLLWIRSKTQLTQPDAYDATMDEIDTVEGWIEQTLAELHRRRHARLEYREFSQQRSVSRW